MKCKNCGSEIDYDEGIGNSFDGYICFECDDENKKTKWFRQNNTGEWVKK